jgi:hypothetical protein
VHIENIEFFGARVPDRNGAGIRLEGGAASGDGNRFDDRVTDFRFHPDYNVGLILFDELLATVTAAQAFNVVDQLGEGGPVAFLGANSLALKLCSENIQISII